MAIQINDANEIEKNWGNKPCLHEHVEKEYYLGADTGDLRCTNCGRTFSRESYAEMKSRQQQKEK